MTAVMKMLYGPPGTGKTWLAAREAVKAVEPDAYMQAQMSGNPATELQRLHQSLVNEGRILWVTFHANYSYEDFVEGYRPVTVDGSLTYEPVDGPFKRLCERVRHRTDLEVGDRLPTPVGRAPGEIVEVDEHGWVVRVTPNREDEVAKNLDKYVPRRVIERAILLNLPPEMFSIPGSGFSSLADYGLSETDDDVPPPAEDETVGTRKRGVIRKIFAARLGMMSTSDISNSAHYGAVMRKLKEIRSRRDAGRPVALVIDEFNRADPSRVFGELLTLLEQDKREGLAEERKVWLPYTKKLFSVPQSVSVIGTMNTVDKSLAPIDFAMRRRFRFEYVGPSVELVSTDYGGIDVRRILQRINARLSALLGTGYEMGHAFFLTEKLGDVVTRMNWSAVEDASVRAIAYVLRTSVLPTIAEYFHDDWRKVRAVAGETVVNGSLCSLFEVPEVEDVFIDRLPEDYELVDGRVAYYADWWDPNHVSWDATRVRDFLVALASGA
jgi:5-methylcytosine-specific restriction protein B